MKAWLKGLIGAALNGSASAVTAWIVDPSQFNFNEGLSKLGVFALVGGIFGMALYLKQSPLPQ